MRDRIGPLAAVSTISLVLSAAIMVPGMLGQPSLAVAQLYGYTCSPGGVNGCYSCISNPPGASPSNTGCDGVTNPPNGMQVGTCVPYYPWNKCSSTWINCGNQVNCLTNPPQKTGNGCASLEVCQ